VPLRSLLQAKPVIGPQQITRYNNLRAVTFNGTPAPGRSSGEALAAMERISQQALPADDTFEWTGTALQERQVADKPATFSGLPYCSPTFSWLPSMKAGPCRLPFCSR